MTILKSCILLSNEHTLLPLSIMFKLELQDLEVCIVVNREKNSKSRHDRDPYQANPNVELIQAIFIPGIL